MTTIKKKPVLFRLFRVYLLSLNDTDANGEFVVSLVVDRDVQGTIGGNVSAELGLMFLGHSFVFLFSFVSKTIFYF